MRNSDLSKRDKSEFASMPQKRQRDSRLPVSGGREALGMDGVIPSHS